MQLATLKIRIGGFSKPVTKANADRAAVIVAATTWATEHNAIVLVKRDWLGRWQGWAKRATARGVAHPGDYEFLPTGRRAKKRAVRADGGIVYVADTAAPSGEAIAERHWPL